MADETETTTALVARVRAKHVRKHDRYPIYCGACLVVWPCDTAQLLAATDAAAQRAQTAEAERDRLAARSIRLQHAVENWEGIGHRTDCPAEVDAQRCDETDAPCPGHRACECGWAAVAKVLREKPEASEARIDERMVAQDVAVAEAEARVRALVAALTHVRACATCSELDWAECGDGRDALALLEETR